MCETFDQHCTTMETLALIHSLKAELVFLVCHDLTKF